MSLQTGCEACWLPPQVRTTTGGFLGPHKGKAQYFFWAGWWWQQRGQVWKPRISLSKQSPGACLLLWATFFLLCFSRGQSCSALTHCFPRYVITNQAALLWEKASGSVEEYPPANQSVYFSFLAEVSLEIRVTSVS